MTTNVGAMHIHILRWKTLASDVIAVAVARPFDGDGAWTAYLGAVAGWRHEDEYLNVVLHGEKLHHRIAGAMFPEYAERPYVY